MIGRTERIAGTGGGNAGRWLRLSLLVRLLAMFALGGALGLGVLIASQHMLRDAAERLERAVADQVIPLAATHRLQTQANELRTLELELPQMHDFFALAQHLERMEGASERFSRELSVFLGRMSGEQAAQSALLIDHWQRYRQDLAEIMALARAMELKPAADISRVRSRGAYAAISANLHELVAKTERAAEEAYLSARAEQERQMRFFLTLSLAGFVVLGGALLVFSRSVALRLHKLRDAASRLAAGSNHGAIEVRGEDEIGELAVAFNAMQDKVVAREQWLRTAHEELEDRVRARTHDLAAANARLRLLSEAIEQSPVGVLVANVEGRVEYVNRAYLDVTGCDAESVLAGPMPVLDDGDRSGESRAALAAALRGGIPWEAERHNRRPDGSQYWEHLRLATVFDERGAPAHLLLMREDISERKEQEEKVAYQAYYDALTGLPNRILALDRLQHAANHARRDGTKCAAMFLDLDNFKQINDTLGHAAGDTLLCQAAERLRAVVRDEDTVARLGGDEFLVIMGGLADGRDAERVARKIIAAFAELFRIEDRDFSASASIGMALFPDDGTEPSVLLRNADLAMYEAKEAGRNTFRFFNQKIHDDSVARLELERMLRGALQRGELSLHFQPLVAATDGALIGAEALLRWDHPQLGRVAPDRFIPVAEQSGLIVEIGAWVLDEACRRSVAWRAANQGEFMIAVNVSPRQFACPGLVEAVRDCLERHAIPPGQLEIEVTEGLLIRNTTEVRESLAALDGMGVAVSLDDFGTGYSSISYVRSFPFHTIKIDRSFIRDLSEDAGDRALVVAAIRMAHALGLRIVAEGVETDAQRHFLAAQKAHVLQGYLFGRPKAADEFAADWFGAA